MQDVCVNINQTPCKIYALSPARVPSTLSLPHLLLYLHSFSPIKLHQIISHLIHHRAFITHHDRYAETLLICIVCNAIFLVLMNLELNDFSLICPDHVGAPDTPNYIACKTMHVIVRFPHYVDKWPPVSVCCI